VSLVPNQARRRDDHREAGDGAHDARHLWISLQACDQTAGQGGLGRRQLLLQGPLLYQAGLIPSDAVLNKIQLLETVLFYRYGTGIKIIGTVPVLKL
jgi:hypothetical protein